LNSVDYGSITGLTDTQVAERIAADGYNELPSSKRRSILAIAFGVVQEPMFVLLVACGTIYLFLGSMSEALMLLGFVFVIMGITLYQERKTERALEALRDLSSPRALVIRAGRERRIAGRELVRDDIIVLAEGDRVPADAVLLNCSNFHVDESLLTGESVPVRKTQWDGKQSGARPGGDGLPFIFSGTLVVKGQGMARVTATGQKTELGKIGKSLLDLGSERTLLQKEIGRLVKQIAVFGAGLCVIVIVVYGLTRANWLNGFLAGLTLAMALLPEEFPVVLTIFLALGAWRMSKKSVLTRRVPAVETLGSATVLCVDKTGTLTMNSMTVKKLSSKDATVDISPQGRAQLDERFHELVEFAILASQRNPFDPMEKAIKGLGTAALARTEHLHDNWTLVREYPLSESLLAMSHVWISPDGRNYIIAVKGAPEAVADLCHFDEKRMRSLMGKIREMSEEGLRILGVAKAYFQKTSLPGQQHDFVFEFLGLVGLEDPVRPGVADAIGECYGAGIRVVMITGDYPGTARNIGKRIGLENCDASITGQQLEDMDDAELKERISGVNIFARVVPEQKLRIVKALKANDEIVAMTGDGVNDAPALKSANIGIAMGQRGTDVAREAASIVLLNDDFSSIVQAVRMGRRIYDNLKKAMSYILAIHVPIAGMSLLPVVFNWPLVLLPVHIVFLELVIDPACSVVFEAEPEESGIMKRPPRKLTEPLFGTRTIGISLLQGLSVLIVVLAIFVLSLYRGKGAEDSRTLTFTTLIIANIGLIFTNRSWDRMFLKSLETRNTALWLVVSGAVVFLTLVLTTPFLRALFGFSILHPIDIVICIAGGFVSVLWFEIVKAYRH
jgi:Ca2+-transporting ATPase